MVEASAYPPARVSARSRRAILRTGPVVRRYAGPVAPPTIRPKSGRPACHGARPGRLSSRHLDRRWPPLQTPGLARPPIGSFRTPPDQRRNFPYSSHQNTTPPVFVVPIRNRTAGLQQLGRDPMLAPPLVELVPILVVRAVAPAIRLDHVRLAILIDGPVRPFEVRDRLDASFSHQVPRPLQPGGQSCNLL